VHLFQTSNRYGEAGMGIDWVNALLDRFGTGLWCVTADIDELLVYPGSEQASLRDREFAAEMSIAPPGQILTR